MGEVKTTVQDILGQWSSEAIWIERRNMKRVITLEVYHGAPDCQLEIVRQMSREI